MRSDSLSAGNPLLDADTASHTELFSHGLCLFHHRECKRARFQKPADVSQGRVGQGAYGIESRISPKLQPNFGADVGADGGFEAGFRKRLRA